MNHFEWSKTYCGYCTRVKQLLTQIGAVSRIIELDQESKDQDRSLSIYTILLIYSFFWNWWSWWRRDASSSVRVDRAENRVPDVFIGGKHIGGCDGTTLFIYYFWVREIDLTHNSGDFSAVIEQYHAGKLVQILGDAGAIANNSSQLVV